MPGLSTWAVRRPVLALIAWLVTVAAIGVLGIGFGGNYNDSFDLPDTESKAATDLLIESGTDTSGLESGATARDGGVRVGHMCDQSVRSRIDRFGVGLSEWGSERGYF